MMRKFSLLLVFLLASLCALAEGTRTWQQTTFEDFEKGTTSGVAINSEGSLELAPSFKAIATTPSTYIWALASDGRGDLFAAAGSPARVYRITPEGRTSIIFEPQELQVQSLVVAGDGLIYAATSPDGKVYKIERRATGAEPKTGATTQRPTAETESSTPEVDPAWSSSVLFDPRTKYIWDLALNSQGQLYVATGDRGEIFRVEKNGLGSVFFKSDEAHIRSLALDPQGNLIAGSDGSGLVYRISPAGEAFVLYSAPKKEITALTVDKSGNIYAAGVGTKRQGGALPVPTAGTIISPAVAMPSAQGQMQPGQSPGQHSTPQVIPPAVQHPISLPGATPIGGSEIYQIAPDGSPKRLWSSREDVVYALVLDGHGHLLAGTGNGGKIFSITNDEQFTDLLKASATQVTAFAKAPGGGLYVSTSNLGKVFLLGATPDAEGTFQSDVFDAKIFSRWGRAELRAEGNVEIWARSGNVDNPDRNWSAWKQVDLTHEAPMAVPPARFVQWKAVLRPGIHPARVESVLLNYLPKNVAPKVDTVDVQVGWRLQSSPRTISDTNPPPVPTQRQQNVAGVRDRNSIAVRWAAHDDNDDELVYSVYYRGDGERNWKLLKDGLLDPFFSFDSGLLPDGGYKIRVVATDAPSHSPEEALTDDRESNRFEVDTTPPQVQDLNASVEGDQLHITFRAVDGFSDIRRAEYSVDAGDWQYVEPVGRLSDYRLENYDFSIPIPGTNSRAVQTASAGTTPLANGSRRPRPAGGGGDPLESAQSRSTAEHLIVVRVYDKFDNVGVAKTVLHSVR